MSEIITSDPLSVASEKPVHVRDNEIVKFPPFPDPSDGEFEDDILEEERNYYKNKYPDLNAIKNEKLHCTACDRHLGCSARNESRMRMHPMLRTLMCNTCHTFYNSGEFDKGEDGSELYCRWCGQGGQVYCCSDCPVVFCAKCIKRNFGMPKIREIENTDDWKCFKCNSKCLWNLRAMCWALLRYCDLRNKFTYKAQDPEIKEAYQKACATDDSQCCKAKLKARKEKEAKKKELGKIQPVFQRDAANKAVNAISTINAMAKIPPTIQVKKFASINLDESPPPKEKKAQKRPAELPKTVMLKNPVTISNRLLNPIAAPMPKKIRMPNMPMQMPTIRMPQKSFQNTYTRIRPKPPPPMTHLPSMAVLSNYLNNPSHMQNMINNYTNDNINLSLENLTQGLDMSAVAGMSENDVVCTPDFPLEPLCEVHEDNNDDDVQCMTPGPVVPPLMPNPPPLVQRGGGGAGDVSSDNIVQMTENDVTVNAATGGLKFRVDPQTLSSNKMYRLPDGRVFAINSNPNMPGGYSATIVALAENNSTKPTPGKGSTYAAKLSAVSTPQTSSPTPPPPPPPRRNHTHTSTPMRATSRSHSKRGSQRHSAASGTSDTTPRVCDLKIPVEWYRYNLIDAVDALEYSLSRLQKLKKESTTMFLRTRNVEEMHNLHKTLDSMLKTSSCRFNEIRDNLNKEMKRFVKKKTARDDTDDDDDEDDDDVEILNDTNEEPIFIDENSMDSNNVNETNGNMTAEVDLTGPASSDHNDSGERVADKSEKDPLDHSDLSNDNSQDKNKDEDNSEKGLDENDSSVLLENLKQNDMVEKDSDAHTKNTVKREEEMNGDIESNKPNENYTEDDVTNETKSGEDSNDVEAGNNSKEESLKIDSKSHGDDAEKKDVKIEDDTEENNVKVEEKVEKKDDDVKIEDVDESKDEIENNNAGGESTPDLDMSEDKIQDTEMTEELIDSLLKEDNVGDDNDSANLNCMDIPEDFPEP